jgi:hypothetical protein
MSDIRSFNSPWHRGDQLGPRKRMKHYQLTGLFVVCLSALLVFGPTGCATVSSEKSCWTDPAVPPDEGMPLVQRIAYTIWWPVQYIAYGMASGPP